MATDTPRRAEAVRRLLEAWRGEMQARTVYPLLAERESDPRRAEIIREIAEGEGVHRERIERRLRELGEPVPDPKSFQISPWLRLQARLAAPERLLALLAHFLVGAAKSLFTLRTWWSAGLEMTAAGVIVGVVTYLVGLVFHT